MILSRLYWCVSFSFYSMGILFIIYYHILKGFVILFVLLHWCFLVFGVVNCMQVFEAILWHGCAEFWSACWVFLSVLLIGGVGDGGVLMSLSLMIIFHAQSFMFLTFCVCLTGLYVYVLGAAGFSLARSLLCFLQWCWKWIIEWKWFWWSWGGVVEPG